MKPYTQHTFFNSTYCEYSQVDSAIFTTETPHYKSKSGSEYLFTQEGVYRHSNHWGRVADCRWKLKSNENYKNQQTAVAFAKWTDFYPLNNNEALFYIQVNFDTKKASIHYAKEDSKKEFFLFTLGASQKRVKQITNLLRDEKWAKYYAQPIDILRVAIISELINSDKLVSQIKRAQKTNNTD